MAKRLIYNAQWETKLLLLRIPFKHFFVYELKKLKIMLLYLH